MRIELVDIAHILLLVIAALTGSVVWNEVKKRIGRWVYIVVPPAFGLFVILFLAIFTR